MEPILEINGMSGGYVWNRPVVRELSLSIDPGQMVGLIGLNGAGKSTTIKHILGLLTPQQGEVRVAGRTVSDEPSSYRGSFAYVPEAPELYEELTIREHLRMTAMAYGLSQEQFESRAATLAGQFDMTDKLDAFPQTLSKGMRQKVMIMNAFLVEPPLYVIDEPFLGLDPLGIRSLLDLMVERKRNGAAFLISSHILSTLESYCDRYVVLHGGRIAAKGTLADLRRTAGAAPDASLDDLFYSIVKGRST
ncbi:ABC transporter ATP-binding protein [Paenibacillus flagellatus]|uniref:Multidrug ABC transporter ATP-binding protein n=1 Tax=Paenibacillus flagellatus TaxID=2211139 RepID=A0A2V5KIU0_9BACL|nr:ABC transporter ATP-binding protein [Paenibacillus flagellatus]PYI50207.1 multidrug ABC transporter ATP-binding protein [Paenibacillus flagellatus]